MSDVPSARDSSLVVSPLSPEEIEHKGHPQPAPRAQFADPAAITGLVSLSRIELHHYLVKFMSPSHPHTVPTYGTIGRILAGSAGSYDNVNWVFTAINMKFRSFERKDIISILPDRLKKSPKIDENLKYAVVFPRLAEIMSAFGITEPALAQTAYTTREEELNVIGASNLPANAEKPVKQMYVAAMRNGLPGRRDKVFAVVRAINTITAGNLSFDIETCS